ncbi:MAG: hypothetical protein WBL67_22380 [Nitrososphaeraceae archaeon]
MKEVMAVLLFLGLLTTFMGIFTVLPSQIAPEGIKNDNAPGENFSQVNDAPLP